jgi:hypothetical protein
MNTIRKRKRTAIVVPKKTYCLRLSVDQANFLINVIGGGSITDGIDILLGDVENRRLFLERRLSKLQEEIKGIKGVLNG